MRIRLILAIWIAKLAILLSRLLGKKGSSMPGQLALKICPGALYLLAKQVKQEIIVVCGTNGKTTTNNLLSAFIKSRGNRVVCNEVGANMIWGVCCAFIEKADIFGRLEADFACLEVDEASCVKVFRHLKPHTVVMTNLFRDQLDRYGAIELTVDYLRRALVLSPETRLVLNADDPLIAQFGQETDRACVFVGVDEDTGAAPEDTKEGRLCVFCGEELSYEYRHYSQLGNFRCPGCGFARKPLDYRVYAIDQSEGLSFSVDHQEESVPFSVQYRGFYNIYNIVLSYAAAEAAMGKAPDLAAALSDYRPQTGRMEEFCIGKKVILNLAKNPAGFNQAISTVLADPRKKDLLLAVNDHESDGMDISWLWDVDFEKLSQANVGRLVLSGIRADELALRMKYAGFPEDSQIKTLDLSKAAGALTEGEAEVCYALVNYTVVFKMQEILKEMEGTDHYGA